MMRRKKQIKRVIEETGYQPSAQARMLRTKKACLVGVVVPKINSESISRVTAGIEQVLSTTRISDAPGQHGQRSGKGDHVSEAV